MAQNDIEDVLDHLRRIKGGGDFSTIKIDQIEKLEMRLGFLRTFTKYHDVPYSFVEIAKNSYAERILEWLHSVFAGIPDECKINLNVDRVVSHLLQVIEGKTSSTVNFKLNDSEYLDCLEKNLNDALMILEFDSRVPFETNEQILQRNRFLKQVKNIQKKMRFLRYLYATEMNGYVDHEKLEGLEGRTQFMADNVGQFCLALFVVDKVTDDMFSKPPYLLCLIVLVELEMKKIFLGELKASKFTQSRTFKDKKLPKGFSHHIHSLLMYLRNKKLNNFPDSVSAKNIDVAVKFLLVFLDADLSNHSINGKWLNEVMEKVGAIAGDVLYVIQRLLPSIRICSIQILEKTNFLKVQVETYYKSLKFTPSQFPTVGGLSFLDSFLRRLSELKSKSGLVFMMKQHTGYLKKELSSFTSILEKELSSLRSIFIDVTKVHHHEREILKDLQRRTINLAYEAEVAIDSILAQYNALWHIFCSLPAIIKEIKHIRAEVSKMWSENLAFKPRSVVEPTKHLPTQHNNPVNDEEIVGFQNDIERITELLIRGTNELDVIPIVGMGGLGKTTISRKVYNNDIIASFFDVRAWCIISQTYNRRELLQDILSQVTGSKDKEDEVGKLAHKLKQRLMGRRYLIVLDDMWDDMAWDDLRLSFPDDGNRSRIILTTRLEEVGKQVQHHSDPYFLPFLQLDESCKLLQKKVFQQEDCPPELYEVSLAVAERCKGLPLVVVLAAGIIKKKKMEESWWHEVKNALFSYIDNGTEEYSLSTMQLNYDYLPDHLRPCLLYMGMFPEDARVAVSRLISLWIAEGFVQNIESGRSMEEAAEGYLMDLISSNVVMVSRRRYNGKVKYCHVHDLVLHFCLEKSREEKFILAVKGHLQPLDWKGSRVSFSLSNELSKTRKPFHQTLRSLITKNEGNYFYWNAISQCSKLRLLKVLDLRVRALSSATLKPLIHLKYLAVDTRDFDFHPEPHMFHLETLIVKTNYRGVALPAMFWEMEKLRHVDMTYAKFGLKSNWDRIFEKSSKMENLRILRGVAIKAFHAYMYEVLLQRCPNLQELDIKFKGDVVSADTCPSLESLTQLQSLRLLVERPLTLSHLHLPSTLKKLVLRGAFLERSIPVIARLPSLEYLHLTSPFDGPSKVWCLRDVTFHKLKFLKLKSLYISRWDVSEESFPLLETLVMIECHRLEEIPLSVAYTLTLKQIKLIGCIESLNLSAVKLKKEVADNVGCDRLDIIIKDRWGHLMRV